MVRHDVTALVELLPHFRLGVYSPKTEGHMSSVLSQVNSCLQQVAHGQSVSVSHLACQSVILPVAHGQSVCAHH